MEIAALERWDVLVAAQDIVGVVLPLEHLETIKGFCAECSTHTLDRLIGLHLVDVPTASKRPWLDSSCGLTRPFNLFSIEAGILPGCHRADVERGVEEANSPGRRVSILRRAVQRFDQDRPRRTA